VTACDRCLRRGSLLELFAGHIETERARLDELLACPDDELLGAVGGGRAGELRGMLERLTPADRRGRVAAAGLHVVCRCSPAYPSSLLALPAPPAALYLTAAPERLTELLAEPAVALVGARRASPYGRELAGSLATGLAGAGVTVVSGMALGIDGVAHDGALRSPGGGAVAVLPGGADRPYPATHRRLYERIRAAGVVVSELPPGVRPRRWMFPARNRVIAGLAAMTVVVQARPRSGALVTARHAMTLKRPLGAVPGSVTSPLSAGPHALIRQGCALIAGPQDVLDILFGPGARRPDDGPRARVSDGDARLLDALREGYQGSAAFARAGLGTVEGLEATAALEMARLITREPGGRLAVAPRA
jgi:DNA processing protein